MRTPRPFGGARRGDSRDGDAREGAANTLMGNGWLRESPTNVWPQMLDIRGRSALRKCMFLPALPGAKGRAPAVSAAAVAKPRAPQPAPIAPPRRNPDKDVRMFPATSLAEVHAKQRAAHGAAARPAPRWHEDPIVLGTLLIVVPPVGLAALWSSQRYSNEARLALTIMTALTMCIGAAIMVALIVALRR